MSGEAKTRFHVREIVVYDEKQPGNPAVASVSALEGDLFAIEVGPYIQTKAGPISVLDRRGALQLAGAIISVVVEQRFSVPEDISRVHALYPSCEICGSEAELDEHQRCPEHRLVQEG